MSPRFLIDRGSHRHLWQCTAQEGIRYFQRPAHLCFSYRGRPTSENRIGKPEGLLAAFAFAQQTGLKTRWMGLIRPFTTLVNPFVSRKPFKKRTVADEQIEAESVIAHCPPSDEVTDNFIGIEVGIDKGSPTVYTYIRGIQYQLPHNWQVVAVIFFWRRFSPGFPRKSFPKQGPAPSHRPIGHF